MDNNLKNGILSMFKITCVVSAISMTIYCVHDFSQNEDTTTVSYKTFQEDKNIPYPQLTLCLSDFSLEAELSNTLGLKLDLNAFSDIYVGEKWDDRVLNVDWNIIASRIKDYLIDDTIVYKLLCSDDYPHKT